MVWKYVILSLQFLTQPNNYFNNTDNTLVLFTDSRSLLRLNYIHRITLLMMTIILSFRHCGKPSAFQWKRRRSWTLRNLSIPDPEQNGWIQDHRPLDWSAPSQRKYDPQHKGACSGSVWSEHLSLNTCFRQDCSSSKHVIAFSAIFKGVYIQRLLKWLTGRTVMKRKPLQLKDRHI